MTLKELWRGDFPGNSSYTDYIYYRDSALFGSSLYLWVILQLCWRLHGGVAVGVDVAEGEDGAALGVGGLVVDGGAGAGIGLFDYVKQAVGCGR